MGNGQLSALLDHLLERASFHVLHDEEVQPAFLPDGVDLNDVGVMKVRDRDRLVTEPVDHSVVEEKAGGHDLDRDFPRERDLVRQKDRRHASASELSADLEFSERRAPEPLDHVGPGGLRIVRLEGEGLVQAHGLDGHAALRTGRVTWKQ